MLPIVVLAGSLCFVGCQKENTTAGTVVPVTETLKLQNVKEENGVLRFESLEHLTASLKFVEKNQKSLVWLATQFPNFTSSQNAYMSFSDADLIKTNGDMTTFNDYVTIVSHENEKYAEPTVDAYLVSLLTSKNGLILVGDNVYKFTYDNVFTFNQQYLSDFLSKKVEVGNIPNVVVFPIKRNIIYDNQDRASAVSPRWNFDWCENQYLSKRKMNGVISTTNVGFWTDVDATTKHQVKGFLGIWGLVSVPQLETIGTVGIADNTSFGVVAVDKRGNNVSKISQGAGNAGNWDIVSSDTRHIAIVNQFGETHECNLIR